MRTSRAILLASASIFSIAHAADARAECTGRPTDSGGSTGYSFDAAEVRSYATTRTKVFYALTGPHAPTLTSTRVDGVPDTVALAGDTGEDALVRYEQMGFRKPPSDVGCPSNGGDDKLDIYLVKFSGADGTTSRESCTGHACASWVLCEATFTGRGYANAAEGFRTVVTHELFHAVQNAYDGDLDHFWAEGTAQWAMKTLHPELMDLERNLPGFFAQGDRSIDVPPGGAVAEYLYGSAIWPVFLTAHNDEAVIKDALEHEADGTESLVAVDAALASRGSSLAEQFPLFVAWNACTKDHAGTGGYAEGATYPVMKPVPTTLDGSAQGITTGLSNFTYQVSVDTLSQLTIDTDAARNGAVLVPLEGGKCQLDQVMKLPATVAGQALVVVAGVTTKKTDAPFTLTVGAPPAPAAVDGGVTNDEGGADGGTASAPSGNAGSGGCNAVAVRTRGQSGSALIAFVALMVAMGRRRSTRRRQFTPIAR